MKSLKFLPLKYVEFDNDFHFLCMRLKTTVLGKHGPKSQYCQFELELNSSPIRICRIQMVIITFPVFDRKYTFSATLVQKFKIVCSKWYSIRRLIRIHRMQWWYLVFLILTGSFWFYLEIYSRNLMLSI